MSKTAHRPQEVFFAFLKLGLTSFGGPIAHLGYFRDEFVTRRQWLNDTAYAELVALCQFLPGPASSQVGFALGLMRAGWGGALAAFIGFTLPSALIMLGFALGVAGLGGTAGQGALAGLKVVAVAIVAQAVWGMARSLCAGLARKLLALLAGALVLLVWPGSPGMIAAIVSGALAGVLLLRDAARTQAAPLALPVSRRLGVVALAVLAAGLAGLPLLAPLAAELALIDALFRAGALVFGGGHVVLPLLQAEMVATGWVGPSEFLAGYGAAQAVPGPLFTVAAYLGAVAQPVASPLLGAALALGAIFMAGFLALVGVVPFWQMLRASPHAQAGLAGVNAAVVGILGAALIDPILPSGVTDLRSAALALLCLGALMGLRAPAWAVVGVGVLGGALFLA